MGKLCCLALKKRALVSGERHVFAEIFANAGVGLTMPDKRNHPIQP
jgi:hypothetical protein